jgi:Zn-dependent protease with chaperone function
MNRDHGARHPAVWADVVVSAPAFLLGLGTMAALGALLERFGVLAWWALPLAHLLASPLVLWRPFERFLVALSPQLRPARGAQLQRVASIVEAVAARCGVEPKRWLYVIEDIAEVNASTSGRHVLAVTPSALTLPDAILAAVIAHELGHQVGGDTAVKGLRWWSLMPVRVLARITRLAAYAALALAVVGTAVLAVGMVLTGVLYLLLLPLSALYPLHAWVERRNELAADAFAARAGYGPALAALLTSLAEQPRSRGLRRVLDTHPHPADRLRALHDHGVR